MMNLIEYVRSLLGSTDGFWRTFESNNNYSQWNWDYGLLFEYFVAGVILVFVISNVFKLLRALFC